MNLIDKISSISTLTQAWNKVSAKKTYAGYDGITGGEFSKNLKENLELLSFELSNNIYTPYVPKGLGNNKRISLLTIRDRIVSYAVLSELEWCLSELISRFSFAYQKDKSVYSAIDKAKNIIFNEGVNHYFKVDIRHFFDSIDHDKLMHQIKSHIPCLKTQNLIKAIIETYIVENGDVIKKKKGLIWGSPLSPLLSNLYMVDFDYKMGSFYPLYIRYSDDILMGSLESFCQKDFDFINQEFEELKLNLNDRKTEKGLFTDGLLYLGFELKKNAANSSKRLVNLFLNPIVESIEFNNYINSEIDWLLISIYKIHHKIDNEEDANIDVAGVDWKRLKLIVQDKGTLIDKLGFLSDAYVDANRYDLAEGINKFIRLIENSHNPSDISIELCQCIYSMFFEENHNYYIGEYKNHLRTYEATKDIITVDKLKNHFVNQKSIAVAPMNSMNQSSIFVIDIDIEKRVLIEFEGFEKIINGLLRQALTYALNIQSILKKYDIASYIEFSGYKGYHVWIFLKESMSPQLFWKMITPLVSKVYKPKGIMVEKIPKMLYEDQELIKVPYSYHEINGKQASFITNQGQAVWSSSFFREIRKNDIESINQLDIKCHSEIQNEDINQDSVILNPKKLSDFPNYVLGLYEGCRLMKSIVDKSFSQNYLNHFERNAILYTFGHLGNSGKSFVHFIISQCINYNSSITESYIGKLKEFPVSCTKLKLRFADIYGDCECNFLKYKLFYPSPVIHAYEYNKIIVTKPDYVQQDLQVQQTAAFYETSKINALAENLMKLLKSKNQIEKDLKGCMEKLEGLFEKNDIREFDTDYGKLVKIDSEWMFKLKIN